MKDTPEPLMSNRVFKERVFPLLDNHDKVFFVVLDNFRYDQWRVLAQEIGELFDIDEELYCSILPTATQYARNSLFSGLMPLQVAKMFPDLWVDEDEDEGKNLNEGPLIQTQLERYRRHNTFSYSKINNSADADRFISQMNTLQKNDLNVVVSSLTCCHMPAQSRRWYANWLTTSRPTAASRCHGSAILR